MLASEVLLQAAVLLNDASQEMWTNAVLLPCLTKANEELEQLLEINEISVLNQVESPVVTVNIGDTVLPQYPTDLVEPLSLMERPAGSTDNWTEVTEVKFIDPNWNTDTQIVQWAWRDLQIFINPPQTTRETYLNYVRTFIPLTSTGATVEIPQGKTFLAARTAQIAALNLGNNPTKALSMQSDVLDAQYKLIQRLSKNDQGVMGTRRRAYKGRFRRIL